MSEMKEAISAAKPSSAVYFYQGVFLSRAGDPGARDAFQKALALDDGTNRQIIQKKIASLGPAEPVDPLRR